MLPGTRGSGAYDGTVQQYVYAPVEQRRRSTILEVGGARNVDLYSILILK